MIDNCDLVGRCNEVNVNVCNKWLSCVLDTGSQVYIVPLSFYKSMVNRGMKKCPTWLSIRVANGEELSYLGYFESDIEILGRKLKKERIHSNGEGES